MTEPYIYVLDSDVFIAAKNGYYAFDICPGFWRGIVEANKTDRLRSIDRVRAELLAGSKEEDLVQWVKRDLEKSFFHDSATSEVNAAYAEIMLWAQRSPQYFDRAKAKFATEADGWLVAYSMVHETIVVTNEQPRPDSKARILLPDVCAQFDVEHIDTFLMLRRLAARFGLESIG